MAETLDNYHKKPIVLAWKLHRNPVVPHGSDLFLALFIFDQSGLKITWQGLGHLIAVLFYPVMNHVSLLG